MVELSVIVYSDNTITLSYQEIQGHKIPVTAQNSRKNMVSLPQGQYPLTSDLCAIRNKPSGLTLQTDSTRRMFSIAGEIFGSNSHFRSRDLEQFA
ncbi:hypothetical protein AYI69_g3202 [Smittium culicis]|uniref:Uncharacterized protein n=1 Tax=Smittium culicis TaxID=133412 RepID=A0A1R1YKB9_9FUNG|nr:hypothetical protein AYI69_g3202 [Smittium culicis]